MGIRLDEDLRSVTEFRANAAAIIDRVRTTRRPVVLTQHGRGAAVLVDVREYQSMIDRLPTPGRVTPPPGADVICRVWRGWTTPENADLYEELLGKEIFVGIEQREIPGYRGIRLLRRDVGDEVEFVTQMEFESLAAVRAFAGEDYEVAVVPPAARALLVRFDERSQHYAIRREN